MTWLSTKHHWSHCKLFSSQRLSFLLCGIMDFRTSTGWLLLFKTNQTPVSVTKLFGRQESCNKLTNSFPRVSCGMCDASGDPAVDSSFASESAMGSSSSSALIVPMQAGIQLLASEADVSTVRQLSIFLESFIHHLRSHLSSFAGYAWEFVGQLGQFGTWCAAPW